MLNIVLSSRKLGTAVTHVNTILRGVDLSGKIYAISGAEKGVGLTMAVALTEAGATVLMGSTDANKGPLVAEAINKRTGRLSAVCTRLDVGDSKSIAFWSEGVLKFLSDGAGRVLNGLIHHTGAMGLGKYTLSADGEEMQWAMNYSGPFRVTQSLWGALAAAHDARVVCLSSASHRTPDKPLDFTMIPGGTSEVNEATYHGWAQYQQSKLATVLFSNELNRRFAAAGALGSTSVAACESDKWLYLPELMTDDDKAHLTPGPVTSVEALVAPAVRLSAALGDSSPISADGMLSSPYGGLYLEAGRPVSPGDHALCEATARQLWDYSMAKIDK